MLNVYTLSENTKQNAHSSSFFNLIQTAYIRQTFCSEKTTNYFYLLLQEQILPASSPSFPLIKQVI